MNHKDKAPRIAYKAFIKLSQGKTFASEEYRMLADLYGIALPMKYRFTKQELKEIGHPDFVESK